MLAILLGFVVALAIGITGVGGGVITVPVLMLFLHIAPAETVGTALAFAAIVKIFVAPAYMMRRQVSYRVLGFMLIGGLPGLFGGLWLLHAMNASKHRVGLTVTLGLVVILTALMNLYRVTLRPPTEPRDRSGWLPWLMLPVGAEVGFSSVGAGAIGSLALLSLTPLTALEVAGTNVLFGLVLSILGGGVQVHAGLYDAAVLTRLSVGGIAGAFLGPLLAQRMPAKPLRVGLCLWLASLGTMLCWQAVSGV